MDEFTKDVIEKKLIARSATKKRVGSKSKKCSLPHDGLTKRQFERMNGPVSVYRMNTPLTWYEFKVYPSDLQEQYVKYLRDTFHVSNGAIANMFGVTMQCLYSFYKSNPCVGGIITRGSRMTNDEKESWERFLRGEFVCDDKPNDEYEPEDSGECTGVIYGAPNIKPDECDSRIEDVKNVFKATSMTEFSVKFSGCTDIAQIENALLCMIGSGRTCDINITCSFCE